MSFNDTERLINDFSCLDPVYVDGIVAEGVMNLGANFGTPYFRWTPGRVENGRMIMQRTPALLLIRPRASLLDPHGMLGRLLDGQPAPQGQTLELRH